MGLESGRCCGLDGTIYAHRELWLKPLLCCAGGPHEHFVHNMVEVEWSTNATWRCTAWAGHPGAGQILCHIIASGMFNGIFEIVVHDMPRDQRYMDVDQLRAFYTAGWSKLMGE